jgi:hypothetical protein
MRNSPPQGLPGVTCRLAPYRGARRGTLPSYAKNPNLRRRTRRLAGCVESIDDLLYLDFRARLGSSLPPDRVPHTFGTLKQPAPPRHCQTPGFSRATA